MSDQNAPDPATAHIAAPRFIDQARSEPMNDDAPSNVQAGLGPFTLREWIVIALGGALTVLSFFSAISIGGNGGGAYTPVWALGITWLGAVFFPLVAVLLIVLRRFVPRVRSLGALSIDQVASVAFAVAAFVWINLGMILAQVSSAIGDLIAQIAGQLGLPSDMAVPFDPTSVVAATPVVWIAVVVSLAGVFFTIVARFVPPFSADFAGRDEIPAHPTARAPRPLVRAQRPATATAPAPAPAGWPGAPAGPSNEYAPVGYAPLGEQAPPFAALATQSPPASQPVAASDPQEAAPGQTPPAGQPVAAPGPQEGVQPPAVDVPSATAPGEAAAIEELMGDPAPHHAPAAQPTSEAAPTDAATERPVDEPPAQDAPVADAGDEPVAGASDQAPDPATTVMPQAAPQANAAPAPEPAPAAAQPFWALAPVERDVHDFDGHAIYKIGPTAWALVLEDRGTYFVMRHDDGRIGYLHNVDGITRG